jgi:hypothetical protein
VYKVSLSWVNVLNFYILLFEVVYLTCCDFDGFHIGTSPNFVQISERVEMTDKRLGRKRELYTEASNSAKSKNARQIKSRVGNMLRNLFDIKGIFHKEFVLVGQMANSTVVVYGDCMKMCEDFAQTFDDKKKKTGFCITTHCLTSFFTREFIAVNNINVFHN